MTTILLVEDEPGLAQSLQTEFEFDGMATIVATDGQVALTTFAAHQDQIDLILLDWMLPKLDGFSVLQRIRKTSNVPVIMLTARDYVGDRVAGLTGGADDYVTKPFDMAELLARIDLALKHAQPRTTTSTPTSYQVGSLQVDLKRKQATYVNDPLNLTQREFALLQALVQAAGEVCSRDALLDAVWGSDFTGQPNILAVYIRQLRGKLTATGGPDPIQTVRGQGYRIVTKGGGSGEN